MSLKLATANARNGKTLIKANRLRVNYLVSQDRQFTRIQLGPRQAMDVADGLKAAKMVPGNI